MCSRRTGVILPVILNSEEAKLSDEENGRGHRRQEARDSVCIAAAVAQPVVLRWLCSRGPGSRHVGSADRKGTLWRPEKPTGHLGT